MGEQLEIFEIFRGKGERVRVQGRHQTNLLSILKKIEEV
jgi:hypothetical protein